MLPGMAVEHIRVLAGRTDCSPEPWFNFKHHWLGWVIVTTLRSERESLMLSVCEGEGKRRRRLIAQGRVSENLCTTELAHLSPGDSPYSGPAVCCCLWRMLPTGLENADPLSDRESRRQNVS